MFCQPPTFEGDGHAAAALFDDDSNDIPVAKSVKKVRNAAATYPDSAPSVAKAARREPLARIEVPSKSRRQEKHDLEVGYPHLSTICFIGSFLLEAALEREPFPT